MSGYKEVAAQMYIITVNRCGWIVSRNTQGLMFVAIGFMNYKFVLVQKIYDMDLCLSSVNYIVIT